LIHFYKRCGATTSGDGWGGRLGELASCQRAMGEG